MCYRGGVVGRRGDLFFALMAATSSANAAGTYIRTLSRSQYADHDNSGTVN